MFRRHFQTKKFYRDALQIAKDTGKELMVIGDPCRGTYFRFVSKYFPNCEHGDITIDHDNHDEEEKYVHKTTNKSMYS